MNRVAVLLTALTASGCGLVSFDIEEPIPPQTVQGGLLGALPVALFDIPLTVDIEAATKARGTGPASAAHLSQVELAIQEPAGETFEFLDSITVSLSGGSLPEVEVARLPDVPAQPRINLQTVSSVDLLPYVKAGAKMRARASGHMPRQTLRFAGKVVVTVEI